MTLLPSGLKDAMEKLRHGLEIAKDPSETMTTNKAEVRLVENQHSQALARGFTLVQDEPVSVFGGNRGPTPTDFFISSIGFCENVIFARNAALAGLSIESLETSVSGTWDRRGLFEIAGVEPFFKTITVETKVTTSDPVAKIVMVAKLTHRTCPVHATVSKAAKMIFKLVVNGKEVPL